MVEGPEGWNKELYDKLSFEYLIACGKNNKIVEWNLAYEAYLKSEWKRTFQDEGYDPENIKRLIDEDSGFVRPDFSGRDFKNANLHGAYFLGAHLERADFFNAHLENCLFYDARLAGANFVNAHLRRAHFSGAHLENANFERAHLPEAHFFDTHLEGASFNGAHLEEAHFSGVHLEKVYFLLAHLENANFFEAHLEGAFFNGAHLEDANFVDAHLEGSQFIQVAVNGGTHFNYNPIDGKTNFTGTSLSSARIFPELRTQLERNIRQIRWEEWYKDNKLLAIPAKIFWKISDYGSSTLSIIFTFLFSNVLFMMFYLVLRNADLLHGYILSPGNDLLLAYMQTTLVPFGILGIDLTTLSLVPVSIIFLQVIFGYTILAALVTRMAIMFQNLSP